MNLKNYNINRLIKLIKSFSGKNINIMEFCGTHTHEIFRYGIRDILDKGIKLLSGPGCPVCVTHQRDIDYIIKLSKESSLGIITFGDLVNVRGSDYSLSDLRAEGGDVRIIYSPIDAIRIAMEEKEKKFVLIGIGFETTAPNFAYTIIKVRELGIKNLYFLSLHKLTPPTMKAILKMEEVKLDGIIGPGHVSTIIGRRGWLEVFNEFKIPMVIMGFEPMDIVYGLYILIDMLYKGEVELVNAYRRSVREEGNTAALSLMDKVFKRVDSEWRGFGILKDSGLDLREEFEDLNVRRLFPFEVKIKKIPGCKCDEVIRGVIKPTNCSLFGKVCTPDNPVGPCMVSSEGACSAYYLYGDIDER